MSYRDDVDTLYTRAMILQRELDAAKDKLAARDEELARFRDGTPFSREDTSPGLRALRELPDPDVVLARLAHVVNREPERTPELPPFPMPSWTAIAEQSEPMTIPEMVLVERVRDGVSRLAHSDLVLVAKLVDELTDQHAGMDDQLRARLRWLASEIALLRGRSTPGSR